MNSPPMAEFLDMIKKKYEGFANPTMYRIVKIPDDGSSSVFCDMEIVWKYDDLCVKMFDLDVSGWEIVRVTDDEAHQSIGCLYNLSNVVTIRMARMI